MRRTILPEAGGAAEDEDGLPGVRGFSTFAAPERLQAKAFLLAFLVVQREHDASQARGDCSRGVKADTVGDLWSRSVTQAALRCTGAPTDLCEERCANEAVLLERGEPALRPASLEEPSVRKIQRKRNRYLRPPSVMKRCDLHTVTPLEVRNFCADLDDHTRTVGAWGKWIARAPAEGHVFWKGDLPVARV